MLLLNVRQHITQVDEKYPARAHEFQGLDGRGIGDRIRQVSPSNHP